MLEYATSEAILNFTADTVLKVHKAVKLGEGSILAHMCASVQCVYIYETNTG